MEETSKRIFQQLDCTGYSHNVIKNRQRHYRSEGKFYSSSLNKKIIIGGSKGDGLTKRFESDEDILHFMDNLVCVENPASAHFVPSEATVFTIVNTEPGYCMVELMGKGTILYVGTAASLVPFNGKVMLSSKVLKAELFTQSSSALSIAITGPAQTHSLVFGLSCDHVRTISCYCRSKLKDFVNRPRPYDWPSSLRQRISQMTGNLVATGSDDSETGQPEWRYCFNEIEMLIMSTLNDTQLKLFKLLKIVNDDIFKQRGLSLTSFIMKNIIFWLAETHAQSLFVPETLYRWLCEALMLLRQYVEANKIPYFMIPGRNLLKEKVKESDRPKLIQVITEVIESGPAMLFECETIVKYAALAPHELSCLKHKMDVLELCYLEWEHIYDVLDKQGKDPGSDQLCERLQRALFHIARSGWPPQVQQQIDECADVFTAFRMLLC